MKRLRINIGAAPRPEFGGLEPRPAPRPFLSKVMADMEPRIRAAILEECDSLAVELRLGTDFPAPGEPITTRGDMR